ncbi:MAG: class I SAM-dependent RNA methyltransferase [Porticoccaceae bacterium]|nr:class I SAM-dependent RNA methyltransferase [Porticoccaceae bacterium]
MSPAPASFVGTAMPSLNDRFTARVRALSSEGSGIVEHPDGQVFFVSGVWLEEVGQFRITGFKNRFGFAVLEALQEPSPHRRNAPCRHHGFAAGQCGGCPWQFVDYQAQLAAKEQRVHRSLGRLLGEDCILPIIGSPRTLGFRNRAQLKTDGERLGFVSAASRHLAPVDDCLILTERNRATLKALVATLPNRDWRPAKRRDWTTLDIDEDTGLGEVAVNRRLHFRQGNDEQNRVMREWLGQRLEPLDRATPVVELFAGSGNFTEVIAAAGFARIVAAEGSGDAIEQLAARRLPGVETLVGNLFADEVLERVRRCCPDAGVLVLDPPRDGLKNIAQLLPKKHRVREVFYISCDLATLARDLAVLVEKGFRAVAVQPLDLFPHSPHVELLCHLRLR